MGFRTTFVSEDYFLPLSGWFVDKYADSIHMSKTPLLEGEEPTAKLPISSKFERKFYSGKDDELFVDLQRVLNEQINGRLDDFEIVLFHECTGITKVHIFKDRILMYEPQNWKIVEDITHSYSNGCSAPKA